MAAPATPMRRPIALLLALATACGPPPAARAAPEARGEHTLELTVDGRAIRASTGPLRPAAAIPAVGPLRCVVGGAAEGGGRRVEATLVAGVAAPGELRLVATLRDVAAGAEPSAWIRIELEGDDPVERLVPVRGRLVLDVVLPAGAEVPERLEGTFHGTFLDPRGLEHAVEGRVRQARR